MGIPSEAVGASVGVLLYSVFCLLLCVMLVGLLISFGESYTYVTIHSCFTALSTFASIIQQIHYATSWQAVKQEQFEKAVRAAVDPGLTFVGGAHPLDIVLFFIQFWCYNIMALNILFWSIALFTGAWGYRTIWMGDWLQRIGPISKVFSVIFPSLIVGLMQVRPILRNGVATFIIANGTMFISLTSGSFLLVLILYKYMKTRRLAAGGSRRGRWWASEQSKSQGSQDIGSHYTRATGNLTTRSSIYDRALITRFSIGFVVNALFLVAIIVFSYVTSTTNAAIVAAGVPDFTSKGALVDIVLFVPGVTASLVTFLVFGTAKSWRQYRDLLAGGCGVRNRLIQRRFIRQQERDNYSRDGGTEDPGLEFAPLPMLRPTPSLEERIKNEETTKRVKMFTREIVPESSVTTTISASSDPRPSTAATAVSHSGWDALSLDDSAAGINVKVDNEFMVQPVALRPAPQRSSDGRMPEQTRPGSRGGSQNMQFHRPRPSQSRASSRPNNSSVGTIDGVERRVEITRPTTNTYVSGGGRSRSNSTYQSPPRGART